VIGASTTSAAKMAPMIAPNGARKAWRSSKTRVILLLLMSASALPARGQSQPVETYGAQSPAITAACDVVVSCGVTLRQVHDVIKAAADDAGQIADPSGKLGVTQRTTATMLRILANRMFRSKNCRRSWSRSTG